MYVGRKQRRAHVSLRIRRQENMKIFQILFPII